MVLYYGMNIYYTALVVAYIVAIIILQKKTCIEGSSLTETALKKAGLLNPIFSRIDPEDWRNAYGEALKEGRRVLFNMIPNENGILIMVHNQITGEREELLLE